MTTIALPVSANRSRRTPLALIAGAMVFLVLASVIYLKSSGPTQMLANSSFYTVVPMDMDIAIRKDGELQASQNLDVVCPVEGLNTIRTIVPEGSVVKKDDVIAELDSSDMKKKLQSAVLDVKKGESDFEAAKVGVDLQKSKNTADIEGANVELKLARIDLKAYADGTYPQSIKSAQRDAEMAKIVMQDKQQLLQDAKSLQEKGFITATDVRKAEVELLTAQNDLDKKAIDLKVLAEYTHEKDSADKENKVAQAEKKVQRTLAENDSQLSQKVADMQAKEQALVVYRQTLEHIQEQVDACIIKAPGDGVVIYGSTAQSNFYRDTPIQPGGKIGEQQLLIRLPDTQKMKVVAKIQEAMAMKLRDGNDKKKFEVSVQIVGVAEPVPADVTQVAVLPDNSNRWWDPDRKEYPVDLTLSKTPANLKPGLTAHVEIVLDHLSNVLAAPLGTIYSEDQTTYVFVRRGDAIVPRKVSLGETTDTDAQVLSGVAAGDQIVLLESGQGRQLLERAGISQKPAKTPTRRPASQPASQPATSPVRLEASTQPVAGAASLPSTNPS